MCKIQPNIGWNKIKIPILYHHLMNQKHPQNFSYTRSLSYRVYTQLLRVWLVNIFSKKNILTRCPTNSFIHANTPI